MSTVNSFKTRRDLNLGGRTVQYLQPAGASRRRLSRNRSLTVLAEDPPREPAPPGGRPLRQGGRHRGARAVGREEHRPAGDLVRSGSRAAAGLHRRAGGGRSRGDARRHRAARRRPGSRQPAAAGGAGDRSLGPGRLLRPAGCVSVERRARVLAQQGALRVPALGTGCVQQFPRRAARYRHRAPGEPRIPRPRGDDR